MAPPKKKAKGSKDESQRSSRDGKLGDGGRRAGGADLRTAVDAQPAENTADAPPADMATGLPPPALDGPESGPSPEGALGVPPPLEADGMGYGLGLETESGMGPGLGQPGASADPTSQGRDQPVGVPPEQGQSPQDLLLAVRSAPTAEAASQMLTQADPMVVARILNFLPDDVRLTYMLKGISGADQQGAMAAQAAATAPEPMGEGPPSL